MENHFTKNLPKMILALRAWHRLRKTQQKRDRLSQIKLSLPSTMRVSKHGLLRTPSAKVRSGLEPWKALGRGPGIPRLSSIKSIPLYTIIFNRNDSV